MSSYLLLTPLDGRLFLSFSLTSLMPAFLCDLAIDSEYWYEAGLGF